LRTSQSAFESLLGNCCSSIIFQGISVILAVINNYALYELTNLLGLEGVLGVNADG
jgi:hypothetical protein